MNLISQQPNDLIAGCSGLDYIKKRDQTGIYYQKIDLRKIGAMGQSCGDFRLWKSPPIQGYSQPLC